MRKARYISNYCLELYDSWLTLFCSIGLYVHGKVIEEEPLEYRQREAEYKRKFGSPPTISTTPTVPTFFVVRHTSSPYHVYRGLIVTTCVV